MPINKKIPLSNIPVKLALVIILVFGLVPGIGFTVYKYRSMTDQLTLAETEFMKTLKTELRGDVDAAISLFTYQREISEHRLKRSIKAAVENAHNMMSQLYDLQKDRMSGPDLAVLLKKSVGAIRLFNGRGNLFILSAQGRDISLPLSSGPQAAALEKQAATQKVLEMAQTQGEGFFRYAWPHPGGFGRTLEKIAYVMRFAPMNWVVGAADYPGGIETSIQQEMVNTFLQFNLDQKNHQLYHGQADAADYRHPLSRPSP